MAYYYLRDGQTVVISGSGVALYDTDGTLVTPATANTPIDGLTLTGMAVDLTLAGWTLVSVPAEAPSRYAGRSDVEMLREIGMDDEADALAEEIGDNF